MKIKYQQFLLLLGTALLISVLLSFFIYNNQKQQYLKQMHSHLKSISGAQANRIYGIISSSYDLVEFPASNPNLVKSYEYYLKDRNQKRLDSISNLLKIYAKRISSFDKLHLLSQTGVILASSEKELIGQDWSKNSAFTSSIEGSKYYDGVHFDEEGELNIYLSSAISVNNKISGVIIIDQDAPEIVSMTQDYTGLGRTGESVLAKLDPDKIMFLAPLRHDPNAALKRSLPLNDATTPSGLVAKVKKDTVMIARDYRGMKIIASARYIPETEWVLITKIDFEEAMEPLYYLRKILFIFNGAALMLSILVAYFAGRFFTKPIEELEESANTIREGNLSVRAKEKTGIKEINSLAFSFNRMTERLDRKIGLLDKYAYVISHDLKAPLNNVQGLVHIIKEEYKDKPLDQEGTEMLSMIEMKTEDMKGMIDNLLQSAKDLKKIKEPINLFHLAHEVVSVLNPPSSIHIFIKHDLPIVKYHRASLIQILQNLIGNSIKYMDKERPLIKVGHVDKKNFHQICITDNGSGVPLHKRDHIFKSFEIGHNDERIESHGLGLSIAKQLVEEHGGKIWVEGEPGEETNFCFTIPKD